MQDCPANGIIGSPEDVNKLKLGATTADGKSRTFPSQEIERTPSPGLAFQLMVAD